MAENTKKWDETGRRYRSYIKLEKRLSENTVESYMRDYMQFAHFILRQWDVAPHKVEPQMVERYMAWLYERGREKTSQARALSGIKSFFNFLMISDKIESSPAEFVLTPKFGRQLPDVLTTAEIDRIIAAVDTSTVKGLRDCAMLEVLYSCGLRVSELTSLRMQDLFFGEGYIRVIGKGDKQRIVPVSSTVPPASLGWAKHSEPISKPLCFQRQSGRCLLLFRPSRQRQGCTRNFAAIIPMRCFFRQGNCRSMPTAMFSHRN